MADPTLPDVLPQVHEARVVPTATPRSAEDVANKAIAAAQAGRWENGVQVITGPAIEQSKIGHLKDQFGIERDASGAKKLNPTEQKRHDDFVNKSALLKKCAEQGFAALDPTSEQPTVINAVNAVIARAYPGINAAGMNAIRARILSDQQFLNAISIRFDAIYDNFKDLGDEVTPAKDARDAAERNRQVKEDEVGNVDQRQHIRNGRQATFDDRTVGTKDGILELEDLKAKEPQIKAERDRYKLQYGIAKDHFEDLHKELQQARKPQVVGGKTSRPVADIQADIATATTEMDTANQNWQKQEADLKKITDLETKQAGLAQEEKDLKAERTKKEAELKNLEAEKNAKELAYQTKVVERGPKEDQLVGAMDKILDEATVEWFRAENARVIPVIQQQIADLKAEIQKEAAEAKTQADKAAAEKEARKKEAVVKALNTTFITKVEIKDKKTGRTIRWETQVDQKAIKDYFDLLVTQGVERTVAQLLTTQINPDNGRKFTLTEARALVGQTGFITPEMQRTVINSIVGLKIPEELGGGFASEAEKNAALAAALTQPDIKEALNNALKNPEMAEMIQNLTGAKVGTPEMEKSLLKNPLLWIAILLGIIGIVGFVALKATGQQFSL